MKTRQLITLCALLGTLVACGVSANDAPKPNPGNTSLGNTTVGGYVDSSVEWGSPAGRVVTVKPPTLTITAPKNNAKWSNAVYTVTGTVAKGSAAVANVFVLGWGTASISNTTWKAKINLALGNNNIAAYAVDTNGVASKTNTVTLTYIYAPPVITITAPKTGAKWSNEVYNVTGTVTPISAPVANVFVSVNANGWSPANVTNTTWNASAELTAGTNTIAAYAVDTNGVASKTNTVTLIYLVPLTLTIVGEGTVSPDYSNAFLIVGDRYTMKAMPAKGFGFVDWDVNGEPTSGTSLSFTMVSNLVITANFKDITPPVVTITAPKAGGKFTNSTILVTGTATDNVGVDSVSVQINGNGWVSANGTTSWSAALPMTTGNNTVDAVAMDAVGNYSKTNSVSFIGYAPSQLTWAPTSLTNSVLEMQSFRGEKFNLSFGKTLFSWGETNSTLSTIIPGIGHYGAQVIDTNYILAQLSFTGPPIANGYTMLMDFTFTNYDTGYYSNEFDLSAGTFSLATPVVSLVPTNFGGLKFTFSVGKHVIGLLDLTKVGTFTLQPNNAALISGTFNSTACSPVGAFLTFEATTPTATLTYYLQLTYTAAGKGIYQTYQYTDGGPDPSAFYEGPFTSH